MTKKISKILIIKSLLIITTLITSSFFIAQICLAQSTTNLGTNQQPVAIEEALPLGTVPAAESATAEVHQDTILDILKHSTGVTLFVLILLVVMSVATWGILFGKISQLSAARKDSKKFLDVFWGSRNMSHIQDACRTLTASPLCVVFLAGHNELTHLLENKNQSTDVSGDIESVNRALRRAKYEELNRLEKGTTFLATTASAAPFIGLFGTVWGIMNAFIGLSKVKTSTIQAVAPGISEALIATAVGLFAAIPAAIFYNYCNRQIRIMVRNIDNFSAEFLNIARRDFLK